MTREKIRKKFQLWLALSGVFLLLTFVLSQLQEGRWDDICLGAAFVCVIMAVSTVVRYGRCRGCNRLLDPYALFHGGYCRFCGTRVADEEEKKC